MYLQLIQAQEYPKYIEISFKNLKEIAYSQSVHIICPAEKLKAPIIAIDLRPRFS